MHATTCFCLPDVSAFLNRGEDADADANSCDFEEFIVAMKNVRSVLGLPTTREEIGDRHAHPVWYTSALQLRVPNMLSVAGPLTVSTSS